MNSKKYINKILLFLVTLGIIGCSSEEISYSAISLSDVVGVWCCDDGIYEVNKYTFRLDGTGTREYGVEEGDEQFYNEEFTWLLDDEQIIVRGLSDYDEILKIVRSGENIVLYSGGWNFTKKGSDINPPVIDPDPDTGTNTTPPNDDNSKFDQNLIGEWWRGDVLGSLERFFLRSDGIGYKIYSEHDDDYGIQYRFYKWQILSDNIISMRDYKESTSVDWAYRIDGSTLIFERDGSKYEWRKMNSEEDMSFNESKKPFANNYIKYKITGYYYEISKVISGCEHAGPGSNMNERYLHFFGADGKLNPTGLRIFYHTPSWEGIDSKWYSGTYVMSSSSGAWKYYAMGWCNGRTLNIYEGGVLKITTNQSYIIYDFDDDEIELHVVVVK